MAKTAAKPAKAKTVKRSAFALGKCDVVTFAGTARPAESRKFYEEALGLRFVGDESFALVFELNGIMLRIQKMQELTPARSTVLGWKVPDIAAAVRALRERGVQFQLYYGMDQDELGIWTSPSGARVAWFKDPDGNTLSLTEFGKARKR
jgi:catechol 2,3-dioxygenase-like lactoylglutathione lyase family enzyme